MKRPFSPSVLERDQSVRPRSLDFDGNVDHAPVAFEEVEEYSGSESPSNMQTPPRSPPDDEGAPPQTPSPKKRTPSRAQHQLQFGASNALPSDDAPEWFNEVPRITHSVHGSDEDDLDGSDGISPIENSSGNSNVSAHATGSTLHLSVHNSSAPARKPVSSRAPGEAAPLLFNDSFVGNAGDESAFASPPPAARKQPAAVPPLALGGGINNSRGGDVRPALGLKSPRPAKSLHFGAVPAPLDDLNYSSIRSGGGGAAGKGLMAAPPARVSPRAPPAGASASFFHPAPPRSPAAAKHSQSMFVTGPGLGAPGGEDDVGNFSLHRQQQLSRTPRNNPYQLSPKSHLGSAKKKTRLSMVALTSRYVQDFEEERRLGKGNFSDVYQCRHVRDGLMYAVKILRGEGSESSKVLKEVWALAALPAHENVIRYYGCWMEDNKLYIQTEFCEEGSLEAKLVAGHAYGEAELLDMLRQILAGVAHMHRAGLCHLDIKPENVLVSMVRDGAVLRPVYKLADLGLVRHTNLRESFLHDLEGGDGRFVSPELMEGDQERLRGNLEKSDVWSVGCTVYALARQRDLPTGGDEYAEIRSGNLRLPERYSAAFMALLRCMVCPDLERRLTAGALLEQPLLLPDSARRHCKALAKKARLQNDVRERDREIELLRLELALARSREHMLADELQRARVDAAKVDQRLADIFALIGGKNADK